MRQGNVGVASDRDEAALLNSSNELIDMDLLDDERKLRISSTNTNMGNIFTASLADNPSKKQSGSIASTPRHPS